MKKITHKALALLCIVVIMSTALAGCSAPKSSSTAPSQGSSSSNSSNEGGMLFSEPVEFSMLMASHPSWPFQEDWYVKDLIKEKTNVSFKAITTDNAGYAEKLNLTMSGGDLPDLIYLLAPNLVHQYGSQGAFVNVFDHMDKLPNFSKWYEENKSYALNYLSSDGALYMFPQHGVEETNRRGWLYREDVFKKHNLKAPKTQDEFYDVLVALKKEYPNSYPLAMRSFVAHLTQFNMIAPSWGTDHIAADDNRYFNYDFAKKDWVFGPTSTEYKSMIEFYNKLYKEGLLLPNFLTIDTKGWQDVIANSDSFITLDYLSRIDFFNNSMRPSQPDFTMSYMEPAAFGNTTEGKFPHSARAMLGFVVSSQTKQLDKVLAYVDWMYSDEARDLLTWGRPNELYTEDASGNRKWNDFTSAAEMKKGTGLQTYGFYQRYNFDGELSTFSPECRAATEAARKFDLPEQPVLAYNDTEKEIVDTAGVNIQTFVSEQISKFILGERSMGEWDKYVAEVEKLGLSKLKAVHESSYARVLEAQSK